MIRNDFFIFPVVIHSLDKMQLPVNPIYSFRFVIDRESIRPYDIFGNKNYPAVGVTVHAGSFNFCHFSPIRPKEISEKKTLDYFSETNKCLFNICLRFRKFHPFFNFQYITGGVLNLPTSYPISVTLQFK